MFFMAIVVKFIYSEKAAKFCEISTNYLSYVLPVKQLVEISQNFVAFSEYMNFNRLSISILFSEAANSGGALLFPLPPV